MIEYGKEYFKNNCYFFLKDKGDTISIYYSVSKNLTESRKEDDKMDFNKKDGVKIKKIVHKFLNKKGKVTKKDIQDDLNSVENGGELDELVDSDGTMLSSKVPILQMTMHPKKTTDQTVPMSRVSNDPVTRGYRVYWGESEDDEYDKIISEIDFSDAFGYEETKDKDYKGTKKTLKKMGVEDPIELEKRVKQLGKLRGAKVKKTRDGKRVLKQRLTEKDTIEEEEKKKMIKMVEDILSKKKKDSSDFVKKNGSDEVMSKNNSGLNKIISKNLKSIKNLADKHNISVNQLINMLKSDE